MEAKEDLAWRESFFKENFNVDQCLSKYTLKSDLKTLRSDLKNYGNELHQQMAEILKLETEAIVNLAEYLTNLNSKIDELTVPVSQLREEIKTLYDLIKMAQTSYFNILETIKSNSNRRNQLNLKFGVVSSAMYIGQMLTRDDNNLAKDSVILERAVTKYSFEYNYLESSSLETKIEEVNYVGRKLTEMVNKTFLVALKTGDTDVIIRCLRMYDNLGKQSEAERTYQINVIRQPLKLMFTESHLEDCNQNVDRIYEEALDFIDEKVKVLASVLERNPELKSFNFVLNSFWIQVDAQSREGLPYITAPGNPELFQKRFKSTWSFLVNIAKRSRDENLIYTNHLFQEHIKRFNLPVYFEIRFQQIAGQFESDAVVKPGPLIYSDNNKVGCKLKITLALWESLSRCFDKEVFIDNLADQFLKLSMLLLARYLTWFEVALQEADSFTEGSSAWEDFIINSLNDLNIVKDWIGHKPSQINETVYHIMPTTVKPVLVKVFQLNSKTITEVSNKLQNNLINLQTSASLAHLQNVAAIPRLYRRTNRNAPKEASNYMIEAVSPILVFYNKFKPVMKTEIENILDTVITNITKNYLSLVQEVLMSVCKTEESLRRLKSRNVNSGDEGAGHVGSDTMSDEMKIREQIKLDVRYFVDKLHPVSLENSKKAMEELKSQTC